ncbi:hypothetical protein HDU83_005877 [Entophlyctis luteolus]|nr:hypothetical protein HDU82_001262 [Entophlyctis luteolus]KAJ3354060.1 hypothetical protein HDU83_005877 [Entophlyctis luteolus]KAJ3392168.1 hypothetical protein HDU84_004660 [Entophlyctis sp. JEL0112]
MAVKLRLARWGVRGNPFYGIVAANVRAPRDGRHLERLGTYNPIPDANRVKHVELNYSRIKYWLGVGAQPTDRVAWLLAKAGIMPSLPTQLQNIGAISLMDEKTWKIRISDPATNNVQVVDQAKARADFTKSNPNSKESHFLSKLATKYTGEAPSASEINQHLITRKEIDTVFNGPNIGGNDGAKSVNLNDREKLIILREYLGVY